MIHRDQHRSLANIDQVGFLTEPLGEFFLKVCLALGGRLLQEERLLVRPVGLGRITTVYPREFRL